VHTRYLEDEELDATHDREISLGATTLLGIFLLLAVVCAVFFGFGYTMGRRSAAALVSASTSSEPVLKTTSTAKPAPGSVTSSKPSSDPDTSNSGDSTATDLQLPHPNHTSAAAEQEQTVQQQKPQPAAKVAAYSSQQQPPPVIATPHSSVAPIPAGSPVIVQVAAVSHQEDADTLLGALKRRGYDVAIRHEPQDKLLHIQLGPYSTRKEADTMRQRLLADGYNAIVK
jgi:DedD protein